MDVSYPAVSGQPQKLLHRKSVEGSVEGVCRLPSQLVAEFALTRSTLVILTWLILFIKLHNPLGFFFLPVSDRVYKKETSHSINTLPGNPTVVRWNRLKKDPHLDFRLPQPSSHLLSEALSSD